MYFFFLFLAAVKWIDFVSLLSPLMKTSGDKVLLLETGRIISLLALVLFK